MRILTVLLALATIVGFVLVGGSPVLAADGSRYRDKASTGDSIKATTQYWAIVVGVSELQYYEPSGLHADEDAVSFSNILSPIWGQDHVRLLTNSQATKANIRAAILDWLAPLENSGDVVLFYFAGHGQLDGSSETICPYDTLTTSWANNIYGNELDTWLGNLQSGKQVVILDCCYSGAFINRGRGVKFDSSATGVPSDFVKQLSESGRVVLTSSTGTETSWDTEALRHGVFTYYLLKAFSWLEVVDSNGDGYISAEELFEYAQPRAVAYTNTFDSTTQHPQMSDGYSGGLNLFTAVQAVFDTNPAIASLTIDGVAYALSELPISKEFILGTTHTFDASSTSGAHEATDIESPHPYPGDYDYTWIVTRQNATKIRVHFNYISTEYNYDHVYIKDNEGHVSATYSGIYDHMWSAWVSGDTLKVQLDSDVSGVGDGFVIDGVEWEGNSAKYTFSHWSDNAASASRTMTFSTLMSYVANYGSQYYLSVQSELGNAQGEGWYDQGDTALFSVTSFVEERSGTRYAFTNWSGDSNETSNASSLVMDSPKVVTANWKLQYYLTVQSDRGNPQGGEWYNAGTEATISVRSPIGTVIRRVFSGWSGDSTANTKTATIVMDSPKSVIANWGTDYTRLYIIIGILLAFGLAGAVMVLVRRRRAYVPVPVKEAEASTAIEKAPEQQTVQDMTDEKRQQQAEQVKCPLCGSTDVFEEGGIRRCGGCCIILPQQQTVQNATDEIPKQQAEQAKCPLCGSTDVFEEGGIRRCGGCYTILPR
jgi:transposase-like protein